MRRRPQRKPYQFIVVLNEDDRLALESIADHERANRSDTVRRLIRAAAKRLERSKESTAA
jgi:hypothetical protein